MVLLPAVGIGLLIGFLTGGSLAGFSLARFRLLPLLVLAVVIQVLIFTPIMGQTDFVLEYGHIIYMATILMTVAVFATNLHIPGLVVILIGAVLNGIAIFANGGYMPTDADLLTEAGRLEYVQQSEESAATGEKLTHTNSVIADDDTRFAILGDIFALPEGVPLSNVYSIGDIFVAVGGGATTARTMHLKPAAATSRSRIGERQVA
ncbi:MAG TPA: DUF5317 domain-containing protein [Thermomicrobiales bacterium]|nr:DUF5317 domain-containing protein [Thermomicrobiales bacterium]